MLSEYINIALKNYGQDVEILVDNTILAKTKAFIKLLNSKSTFFGKNVKNVGRIEESNYLYIGPENVRLDIYSGNYVFVKAKDSKYLIKKAEKVYLGNNAIYIWAVLTPYIKEQ